MRPTTQLDIVILDWQQPLGLGDDLDFEISRAKHLEPRIEVEAIVTVIDEEDRQEPTLTHFYDVIISLDMDTPFERVLVANGPATSAKDAQVEADSWVGRLINVMRRERDGAQRGETPGEPT